jgi:hypothetical protein
MQGFQRRETKVMSAYTALRQLGREGITAVPYNPVTGTRANPIGLDRYWDRPAMTALDPTAWYESPGVSWQQGQGIYQTTMRGGQPGRVAIDTPIPEWAAASFGDPASFYEWYQASKDARNFSAVRATLGSQSLAREDTRAAIDEAIGGLGGTRDTLSELLERFRSDPERAAYGETLQERSAPGYRAISETEEGAWRQRIAEAAARQERTRMAGAAGRGTARSGTTLQNVTGLRAMADAQGLRLAADVSARNEAARQEALAGLGRFTDRGVAIESAITDQLRQVDAQIAAIQAGVSFEPTDLLAFDQLEFGQEAYLDEREFAREALEQYEAEGRQAPPWLLQLALGTIGTGLWD